VSKIGDRVGAILKTTGDTVELIGYGTYVGDEIPHDRVAGMGELLREMERPNPKIQLDSGQDVFGCECWWGREATVLKIIGERSIVNVDIDNVRSCL
jgi:hypothetical protein